MRLGIWTLTAYTLRLGCGIVLSLIWLWVAAPSFHIERKLLGKWCSLVSLLAVVIGRLGYGLINSAYFLQNPVHILRLHHVGGIHGESALAGGLLGLGIWAASHRKKRASPHSSYDSSDIQTTNQAYNHLLAVCTPAILFVAAGAWWACLKAGCAWGRTVDLPGPQLQWILTNGLDLYHNVRLRYPVQNLGAAWALLTAILSAIRARRSQHNGLILILYCLGAAALTLFRGDPAPVIGQVRVDTIENLGMALIIGILQWWQILQSRLRLIS